MHSHNILSQNIEHRVGKIESHSNIHFSYKLIDTTLALVSIQSKRHLINKMTMKTELA